MSTMTTERTDPANTEQFANSMVEQREPVREQSDEANDHAANIVGKGRKQQAAYACEHLPPTTPPKEIIEWLNGHGADIDPVKGRSNMTTHIGKYRREVQKLDTNGQPLFALTAERIAALDAAKAAETTREQSANRVRKLPANTHREQSANTTKRQVNGSEHPTEAPQPAAAAPAVVESLAAPLPAPLDPVPAAPPPSFANISDEPSEPVREQFADSISEPGDEGSQTVRKPKKPGRKQRRRVRRAEREQVREQSKLSKVEAWSLRKFGLGAVMSFAAVMLALIIITPIALSSQDIIKWADSATGLGLNQFWAWAVFIALDAAAAFCVCVTIYCTYKDEAPGIFGWLIWVFAFASAFANYRYSTRDGVIAEDAWWFFPMMSLAGPFLLEAFLRRARKWVQQESNKRSKHGVHFGIARWIPGVGSTRETYGVWRLAKLDGIDDADQAIAEFRWLSPTGSVKVVKALRTETIEQRTARKHHGQAVRELRDKFANTNNGQNEQVREPANT